ncbi:MAG TPA: SWIM zinc finger family protein [Frankiaceae bacterium]|nr:SWIM zinc finger family protein [Frankiaceae bacterium]
MEQTYRYARRSAVDVTGERPGVLLATSGGTTAAGPAEHPRFFDGFLAHAEQSATALLTVAKVARTRFFVPPGMLAAILRAADPVVTSNGDRLRFESFSACCGVYARYDVLPSGLDVPPLDTGTTNVDFNPPMREALARVGGLDPLHLEVGEDVVVTTMDGSVTEEKVPLPERWLKGFAEVQVAGSTMRPVLDVPAVEARRFLRSLPAPAGGRSAPLWVVPAARGLRLTSRAGDGAVCLAGPERLRALDPLLRFASRLRAYAPATAAPGTPAASAWELVLDDARLVVTLSPEVSRGFSGEGGVLNDLAADDAQADADVVAALLAFEPRIDVRRLAAEAALPEERVLRALTRLGAAGRVGYDVAEGASFHRELPYDPAALETMHPRLRDARALVAGGGVRLDGAVGYVGDHVVRDDDRCTCPWYGKHQDTRGPCKHVLAVRLARGG